MGQPLVTVVGFFIFIAFTFLAAVPRPHKQYLLSHIKPPPPPNLEAQFHIFISPRNRVAQLYPRALGSLLVASYDLQGCCEGIPNPPPHGVVLKTQLSILIQPLHGTNREHHFQQFL
jgi:hypothetical protein